MLYSLDVKYLPVLIVCSLYSKSIFLPDGVSILSTFHAVIPDPSLEVSGLPVADVAIYVVSVELKSPGSSLNIYLLPNLSVKSNL